MDLKVYRKEDTYYGSVLKANCIDIYPDVVDGVLKGATTLKDGKTETELQKTSLITIWQRGNDLVEKNEGIRWAEAINSEITPIQLQADIVDSVKRISSRVNVSFETIRLANGTETLAYSLEVME